jgi:hypothetical protein
MCGISLCTRGALDAWSRGRSTAALGAMDNPHQVALEQAIRRAFWTVKAPSIAAFLLPLGTYIVLAKVGYLPSIGYAGMRWALPTFALSFVGSWLVWSVQIPRWRLWAYQRVDDIELLKELAVERQYIWPEGSVFQKTEFMSQAVRDQIRALEARVRHGA